MKDAETYVITIFDLVTNSLQFFVSVDRLESAGQGVNVSDNYLPMFTVRCGKATVRM